MQKYDCGKYQMEAQLVRLVLHVNHKSCNVRSRILQVLQDQAGYDSQIPVTKNDKQCPEKSSIRAAQNLQLVQDT